MSNDIQRRPSKFDGQVKTNHMFSLRAWSNVGYYPKDRFTYSPIMLKKLGQQEISDNTRFECKVDFIKWVEFDYISCMVNRVNQGQCYYKL